MSLTITEYRCKLINLILFARSEKHVKRLIHASIRSLKERQLNGHLILRFMEKTAQDLHGLAPRHPEDRQWSNTQMARTEFTRLKNAMQGSEPAWKRRSPSPGPGRDKEEK